MSQCFAAFKPIVPIGRKKMGSFSDLLMNLSCHNNAILKKKQ